MNQVLFSLNEFESQNNFSPLLICFPHAGGNVRTYLTPNLFSCRVNIKGVNYHAINNQNRSFNNIQTIANEVAKTLARVDISNRKLILTGHSLGAYVAYETALILSKNYDVILVVSGQNSPNFLPNSCFHLESDASLVSELMRMDPTNEKIFTDLEARDFFLPLLRRDYQILETYIPNLSITNKIFHIISVIGAADYEVRRITAQDWENFSLHFTGPIIDSGGHLHHLSSTSLVYKVINDVLLDS